VNGNKWKNPNRYIPLDELLDMPRVRILRALRRFESASVDDLRDALDLDIRANETTANTYTKMLSRLVSEGLVEKRVTMRTRSYRGRYKTSREAISLTRYRIVEAGLRELAALLARGIIDERLTPMGERRLAAELGGAA
jgi:DNA-binding transcriptional ArsR family regulator